MRILNNLLLVLELIPVLFLLLMALFLLGDTRIVFQAALITSIISLIALIYIIVMTILNKTQNMARRFVYLAHAGVLITVLGISAALAGFNLGAHSPDVPFAIFSFGLLAFIPYLHVMLLNDFFIRLPGSEQK